jgi:hypothetical protein
MEHVRNMDINGNSGEVSAGIAIEKWRRDDPSKVERI